MTTKTIPSNWKDLVKKLYLLRPIRTKGDYNRAIKIVGALTAKTNLNQDQKDYLESLATLIEAYENKHFPIDAQNPIEILKFLLESNGLNGSDLGRILGQRQLGSKILKGERHLSRTHIKRLAEYFSVEPGLFL